MCGIVGYVGDGNVYDILIKGLHRPEYRGYDSAGIALVTPEGKLNVYKAMGKVSNLEGFCKEKRPLRQSRDCTYTLSHSWRTERL